MFENGRGICNNERSARGHQKRTVDCTGSVWYLIKQLQKTSKAMLPWTGEPLYYFKILTVEVKEKK